MMKGKIEYFLIILISVLSLSVTNVYAEGESNAVGGVTDNGTKNCDIQYTGEDGKGDAVNGQCHKDYNIQVNYNGKSYTGYCADLNMELKGISYNTPYSCEKETDPVRNSIIASILGSSYTRSEKTAALREYTSGLGNNSENAHKLLEQALNGGAVTLNKISEKDNVVTYYVQTTLNTNEIEFACVNGSGCQSVEYDGGSTLTVTITPGKGNCSYSFTVTYPGMDANGNMNSNGGQVLKCTAENLQTIYVLDINSSNLPGNGGGVGGANQNGKVSYTFNDKLENKTSAYYKEYCDDDDENKCDQNTEFEIPEYCDDATDQQIKITAPTDVQYCILNGKDDAGNTYIMDDTQLKKDTIKGGNNPYCAVYCKEDYVMDLPGAQYTTSGRYFKLGNTKVTGTKSCYATNPNKNSDHPQIDIEKFVSDVKKYQENLVKAFNRYQIAKARYESVTDIESSNTNKVTCTATTPTACSTEYDNNAHYGKTKNYKVAQLTLGNEKQGFYRVSLSEASLNDNYGYLMNCNGQSCGATKSLVGTYETVAQYQSDMNSAREALIEAQNILKDTIQFMENCYSWVNKFCMNPDVIFDYNEDYLNNEKFVLKSGELTIEKSDATYFNGKDIDKEYENANQGATLENINYVYCTESDCENGGEAAAINISTLETHLYYRKIVAENKLEYNTDKEYQSNYPHGTIAEKPPGSGEPQSPYEYLGAVFPIALNTPTGVYKWTLDFSNLGQYSNEKDCRNGRLDDVAKVVLNKNGVSSNVEYVCVYVVDCDDCDYDCVGEYCYIPDEKCDDCDVYCVNCIFDGEDTYFYRSISLNKFNPDGRKLGANWTNSKGKATLEAIENNAEEIYAKKADYVITIDPMNMKAIRDYNRDTGTYIQQDLSYAKQGEVTNAYGQSNFLRDKRTQKKYFSKIEINNENWTLWEDYMKPVDGVIPVDNNGLGPAWK